MAEAPQVRRMIVPIRMIAGDKTIETYAMLDGGATNPIVREEIAKKLNLKYEKREAILVTVGEFRNQGCGGTPKMATFKIHFYHHISSQLPPLGSKINITTHIST